MNKYFLFSVLRQMRKPIITIVLYYTIAIFGMVLIPGVDNNGEPYQMGFFHAFYIIVYTSTTIGFGEIPYEWTDNQRLWILICSVIGVVLWVYAMGKIISLSQNKIFKYKINEYRFKSQVEKIKEPFYLVIGYGVTGNHILTMFDTHNLNVVLIDRDENAFDELERKRLKAYIPHFAANGRNVDVLKLAGIQKKECLGAMVVSGSEEDNVKIAISIKLLEPNKKLIVRAEKPENINNLKSFDTDHIVSSNQIFSKELMMLMNREEEFNLRQKLNNSVKKFEYSKKIPEGKWIVCGYNVLTKKVINHLINNNIEFKVIDKEDSCNKLIQNNFIEGEGVSRHNLHNAGIETASVVFAANDDDFKNLSTIITAKNINPDIYTISVQNKSYRKDLFENANIDVTFKPQYTIAAKVHSLISEPYLHVFYNEISNMDLKQVRKINLNLNKNDLLTWHFRICEEKSFFKKIQNGISLNDIIPYGHNIQALMIKKENGDLLLDFDNNYIIEKNDVILFSGKNESFCRQQLLMYNINIYEEYQFRKNKDEACH